MTEVGFRYIDSEPVRIPGNVAWETWNERRLKVVAANYYQNLNRRLLVYNQPTRNC